MKFWCIYIKRFEENNEKETTLGNSKWNKGCYLN